MLGNDWYALWERAEMKRRKQKIGGRKEEMKGGGGKRGEKEGEKGSLTLILLFLYPLLPSSSHKRGTST